MLLIDGHNLIGKIPGIRLSDADDEMQLVDLLQIYGRVKQRDVTVYFDGAAPGFARKQRSGRVTAIYVVRDIPADDVIMGRLIKAGHQARNMVVVTSDRRIQAQARSVQAQVISSEAFAEELWEAQRSAMDHPSADQPAMSSAELDEWLRLFSETPKVKKKK